MLSKFNVCLRVAITALVCNIVRHLFISHGKIIKNLSENASDSNATCTYCNTIHNFVFIKDADHDAVNSKVQKYNAPKTV
jgi:hypothetical protein